MTAQDPVGNNVGITTPPATVKFLPHLAAFSVGYVLFAYAAVPTVIRSQYGIGFTAFGLLMSAPLLAFVLVQVPVSRIASGRSTLRILVLATTVHLLFAIGLDLAPTFLTLIGGRFLWGLAAGTILTVGATHISRLTDGPTTTLQQGLYGGMLTTGGAGGFLLAPHVTSYPLGLHATGAVCVLPVLWWGVRYWDQSW